MSSTMDDSDDRSIEPPWWPVARPGLRRRPLTRQAIIEAAVRVLDRDGVDAMTVRRIGDELGTGSASLYWYFGSKEDLAELVHDHVMGEVVLPDVDAAPWQVQLKLLATRMHAVMRNHNDFVRISARVAVGPNTLRIIEWVLDLLRGASVPEQVAAYSASMLGRFIEASVMETIGNEGRDPDLIGQYFRSLPETRFPNLIALTRADGAPGRLGDELFELGLDLLIRGIASYAADHAGPGQPSLG